MPEGLCNVSTRRSCLETRMKKCKDDDRIIKFSNSIAYLTGKKKEIADDVLGIKKLLKKK